MLENVFLVQLIVIAIVLEAQNAGVNRVSIELMASLLICLAHVSFSRLHLDLVQGIGKKFRKGLMCKIFGDFFWSPRFRDIFFVSKILGKIIRGGTKRENFFGFRSEL